MKRNKKFFLAFAIAFVVTTGFIAYDIATRTYFPGSKKHLKEPVVPSAASVEEDSVKTQTK